MGIFPYILTVAITSVPVLLAIAAASTSVFILIVRIVSIVPVVAMFLREEFKCLNIKCFLGSLSDRSEKIQWKTRRRSICIEVVFADDMVCDLFYLRFLSDRSGDFTLL